MSDFITNEAAGASRLLMSNTDLASIAAVLALAATDLARTDWEKKLALWLVERDRALIPLGCGGFDVEELGWEENDFERQKAFVYALIDRARAKTDWHRMPFPPPEEFFLPQLASFRALVDAYSEKMIPMRKADDWKTRALPTYGKCAVHALYLHGAGCLLCNDVPNDASADVAPHRTAMKRR